jgi:hypothetical protein
MKQPAAQGRSIAQDGIQIGEHNEARYRADDEGTGAQPLGEFESAAAGGVGGQKYARQKCTRYDGQAAADDRRRVEPRPDRVTVPPAGTRPEATAPATAPRKNGVISDEPAKVAPKSLACA